MIKLGLDKKNIKKVEDLNKIMKRIFNKFFITEDGFVYSNIDNMINDIGFHFAHSELAKDIYKTFTESGIIMFDSGQIHSVFRDYKKSEIVDFILDNNSIKIVINKDNETKEELIGEIYQSVYPDIQALVKTKAGLFESLGNKYTNEITTSLIDGEVVIHEYENYRMKISKELFPTISKKSELWFMYSDTKQEETFEAILADKIDSILSFHMYKCIRISNK